MATTTTQIMEYVKIFMATAIDEQWTPEKIQQTWQEKTEDIKNIVEEGLPKKIKKVSSPKDPMKPKRGRSAYIFFCGETREEVKKELGDVKPQQVMRQLGARWKELKESTQRTDKALIAKYTKMAEEDKKRAAALGSGQNARSSRPGDLAQVTHEAADIFLLMSEHAPKLEDSEIVLPLT